MTERPLHDYIDMEAYDVVAGETHRSLVEQFDALRLALERIKDRDPTDLGYIQFVQHEAWEALNPASELREDA